MLETVLAEPFDAKYDELLCRGAQRCVTQQRKTLLSSNSLLSALRRACAGRDVSRGWAGSVSTLAVQVTWSRLASAA